MKTTERERKLARLTKEAIDARRTERKAPLERNRVRANAAERAAVKLADAILAEAQEVESPTGHSDASSAGQKRRRAWLMRSVCHLAPWLRPLPKDRLEGKQEAVKGNWWSRPAAMRLLNDHLEVSRVSPRASWNPFLRSADLKIIYFKRQTLNC